MVNKFIRNNEYPFLFIRGESGYGKTTAIKEFFIESKTRDSKFAFVYSHTPILGSSREVYQSILSTATTKIVEYIVTVTLSVISRFYVFFNVLLMLSDIRSFY